MIGTSPGAAVDRDPGALYFVALGGAGEIGMNLNLYGYADDWLIVDCGVTFGDDSQPGVEVVMPDPSFIAERRDRLLGIVATHAHEDHIGAIPYLWTQLRCPVWATPFTAALLQAKLDEAGLAQRVRINIVPMSGRFAIGPFDLELVTLTHSIPEPNGVVLRTPVGTVFHTGDWKFDPDPLIGRSADEAALRRLGEEGVLAMVCDSTNALLPGSSGSEAELRRSLTGLVGRFDARVAVACFASNVARLETIAHAAAAHGREVALVGRSLRRIEKAARETGYLRALPRFLTEEEAASVPRDRVLLICTGSQGEPRAALARIAREDHPHVVARGRRRGDLLVADHSRQREGDRPAAECARRAGRRDRHRARRVCARLRPPGSRRAGADVSPRPAADRDPGARRSPASDRACPARGPMPSASVARHRKRRFGAPGIGGAAIVDAVPVGRLASDGKALLPLDGAVLKERRRIGSSGTVLASLVLDRRGRLAAPPAASLIGVVENAAEAAVPFMQSTIERALIHMPAGHRHDDDAVREAVQRGLRQALNERFGKRPLIQVHLVRIKGEER